MTLPRSRYADRLHEFAEVALVDEAAARHRGRWGDFFRRRVGAPFGGRVVLEVGCFDAAFLCRVAARHPETAFFGLDWKAKAIYDGARRVLEMGLRNVALARARGQDVAKLFGEGEVDEIWVFHPDPCAGPGELANRLVAEPFLMDAHAVLRDVGSRLTLKTDHAGYYQWVLALLGLAEPETFRAAREGSGLPDARVRVRDLMQRGELPGTNHEVLRRFEVMANSADFWNDAAALADVAGRPFSGEATLFESRFVKARQPIYFIDLGKR
jgi:tRNA G46 methylase TrmB